MMENIKGNTKQKKNSRDRSALVQKINEAIKNVIEEYKAENPDIDVDAMLSEHNDLLPALGALKKSEVEKFIIYAKEQGTGMPFDSMEMGILAAGRKDMQDGLAEILNSMKFNKLACPECDKDMVDRGRGKKKLLTSVGLIEVKPARFACATDSGQSVYPLLDFIGLTEHEVATGDGITEKQTVKCSRNAAASIALACSESTYGQAALILNRLAGLDVTAMTEHRVTDSVGSEFVKDVPAKVCSDRIAETAERMGGNILETRVKQMACSDNKGETDKFIRKAINCGPDGIAHRNYCGPKIKVMYILCDGTGIPGRRQELAGVKGKQPDGSAKTFEAKIGAVFVVEYTIDGKPLLMENGEIYRDKKVRYMGTVRKVEDFGPMLYQHAVDNGLEDMDAVVFLGDGARWVWGIQNEYFPYALTALDLYHSVERVNTMVDHLQFKGRTGQSKKQALKDECIALLRQGKIRDMLGLITEATCKKGNEKKLESAMGYFRSNMNHMNYGIFTACGIFVGSGVIEAGCKVIVGNRMKNAGMHWSKDSAEKMVSLRCAIRNNEFSDVYGHNQKAFMKFTA